MLIIDAPIFIGNTHSIPNNDLNKIIIFGNIDPYEPNGSKDMMATYLSPVYQIIVDWANNSQEILPYFIVEMQYIEGCGVINSNYESQYNCLKDSEIESGVGWVYNWWSNSLSTLFQAIDDLNLDVLILCPVDGYDKYKN